MTDLSKITTPFGLLDEETQRALKECGGPWQVWAGTRWQEASEPQWDGWYAYRQKPQPRVWWMIVDKWGDAKDAYPDKEDAERNSHYFSGPTIVRVVEQQE